MELMHENPEKGNTINGLQQDDITERFDCKLRERRERGRRMEEEGGRRERMEEEGGRREVRRVREEEGRRVEEGETRTEYREGGKRREEYPETQVSRRTEGEEAKAKGENRRRMEADESRERGRREEGGTGLAWNRRKRELLQGGQGVHEEGIEQGEGSFEGERRGSLEGHGRQRIVGQQGSNESPGQRNRRSQKRSSDRISGRTPETGVNFGDGIISRRNIPDESVHVGSFYFRAYGSPGDTQNLEGGEEMRGRDLVVVVEEGEGEEKEGGVLLEMDGEAERHAHDERERRRRRKLQLKVISLSHGKMINCF
jgi:hypothetical protein